jgi:hypothetical protein
VFIDFGVRKELNSSFLKMRSKAIIRARFCVDVQPLRYYSPRLFTSKRGMRFLMIKYGKTINKTLLSRTFSWKVEVQNQNRNLCQSMLKPENHSIIENCLICGFETSNSLEIDLVSYGLCSNCNHLQSSKRPTLAFIQNLYRSDEENYSSQDLAYVEIPPADLESRIQEIAKPKVQFVTSAIEFSQPDLWLDIGSGTGDILVAARSFGFEIQGIEVSSTEIKLAEQRLVPTINVFFDGSQQLPEIAQAKVVSIFNVLEHTLDPLVFLEGTVNQMQSGAYLVIEVPRLESISSIIQSANPPTHFRHIYPPEHLNIFSDKSMDLCLSTLNLKREATWYFGSDAIEIFNFVSNAIDPERVDGFEDFQEEINLLQSQIDLAGHSDVMLVVAKKS